MAAAGEVPRLRADACAAAGGFAVAAAVWRSGDLRGAGAGGRAAAVARWRRGRGWPGRADPAAGAGLDGRVVAGPVRRPGRMAAGGAGGAAAGGRRAGGGRARVGGSAAGDCLAALEGVTEGLRGFGGLAVVAAHEVAAHLTGGLWLAPAVPAGGFNTSLDGAGVIAPS